MIKCNEIVWVDAPSNGNIDVVYGKINDVTFFSGCRFTNDKYPNENWLITSNVIPMGMVKGINLDKLKLDVELQLDEFLNTIAI